MSNRYFSTSTKIICKLGVLKNQTKMVPCTLALVSTVQSDPKIEAKRY